MRSRLTGISDRFNIRVSHSILGSFRITNTLTQSHENVLAIDTYAPRIASSAYSRALDPSPCVLHNPNEQKSRIPAAGSFSFPQVYPSPEFLGDDLFCTLMFSL